MELVNYLISALWNGVCLLAVGLLPLVVVALIMQKFSDLLRNKLAGLLGIKGYIYLTAPGVMIHELSHAVFCLIFQHKILEMKLFSPEEDGTLGYVNHAYNPKNIYHRIGNFFIGTGPIWGGCLMLWVVSWLLLPEVMRQGNSFSESLSAFTDGIFSADFWKNWKSWLWLYLSLTIASHITLSPPDLKGAADGFIVIVLTVLLGSLLLGWMGNYVEVVWQYEIALLTRMFISIAGALFAGVLILFILRFVVKR